MAYGVNAPFGLRPYSHLLGGADDIRTNSNYIIDVTTASTLNKGDPVIYAPLIEDSAIGAYNKGQNSVITRLNPTVTLGAANNATTVTTNPPIVGVFMGCEYWVNGTYYNQEYWVAGTPATSVVKAYVIDDPFVIWDVQLSTYLGSKQTAPTQFLVLPCMQLQNATWPNTGAAADVNVAAANSAIIGSNIALLTGRGASGVVAGGTTSLGTVTVWNGAGAVAAGYNDNPLIANYGTGTVPSNPLGVSTFYGCPSLAGTTANPSVADARNEYARGTTTSLKVLGFTPDPRNVPALYGQPANGTAGTYFNTPFLNVLVTINNHSNKPGIQSVIPA